ncbi:hypothetical protein Tcan_14493 [Toxocara canis]|uniref:Uncharacterized protein n=1 Tax=Toxocara canis TaxID=6265 RepID=A0A0B2V8G9_TOXCA|nr:hypothetical protein Tcan_14493 [Toxocara canis]
MNELALRSLEALSSSAIKCDFHFLGLLQSSAWSLSIAPHLVQPLKEIEEKYKGLLENFEERIANSPHPTLTKPMAEEEG